MSGQWFPCALMTSSISQTLFWSSSATAAQSLPGEVLSVFLRSLWQSWPSKNDRSESVFPYKIGTFHRRGGHFMRIPAPQSDYSPLYFYWYSLQKRGTFYALLSCNIPQAEIRSARTFSRRSYMLQLSNVLNEGISWLPPYRDERFRPKNIRITWLVLLPYDQGA